MTRAAEQRRLSSRLNMSVPQATTTNNDNDKDSFLASLDCLDTLNEASKDRTLLLQNLLKENTQVPVEELLSNKNDAQVTLSVQNPGAWESMQPVAAGTWKVVYAPHMTTMAALAGGGSFDVSYILNENGTMTSHAKLDFPWLPSTVMLSVSGTYGSVSDQVCRVDFDQAWVTMNEDVPYPNIESVPDSTTKSVIASVGRLLFLEQFSIFPISFLDDDLIVFDFELLGTRICARKITC